AELCELVLGQTHRRRPYQRTKLLRPELAHQRRINHSPEFNSVGGVVSRKRHLHHKLTNSERDEERETTFVQLVILRRAEYEHLIRTWRLPTNQPNVRVFWHVAAVESPPRCVTQSG